MRYGFFSDVHGNLTALERAVSALEGVDFLICLGDLVGGPKDEECVARIRDMGIVVVAGNHDLYPPETECLPIDLQEYLADLPQCHKEAGFLALHSYFVARGGYRSYDYVYEEKDALPLLQAFPDRLFFLGHTHVASLMEIKGGRIDIRRPSASITLPLKASCRYLINPGMTSQGVVVFDSELQTAEFRLFESPLDRMAPLREKSRPWWKLWERKN